MRLPEDIEIDIVPHALEGAYQERPPIRLNDIEATAHEPDWTNRPDKPRDGVRYEAQRWVKIEPSRCTMKSKTEESSLSESAQTDAGLASDAQRLCRDPEHPKPVAMSEAIILVHYPRGELPVKGFRCPSGHERLPLDQAKRAEAIALRLGMFGPQSERRRKLVDVGTSKAVTLPPEDIREILHGGTSVIVARVGDHLEIRSGGPQRGPKASSSARRRKITGGSPKKRAKT